MRIASVGHAIFAATMTALGILSLIKGDFAVIWQPVAKGVPGREVLIYLCAFICLASGIGLLWRRTAGLAARVLVVYLLLFWLLFRVPPMFRTPTAVDVYWACCKIAVVLAAAWVLYAWFATDWDKRRVGFATGENGLRIARALFGLALIGFGLAHFQYVNPTASLVPAWLPWHVFWAYFTGIAFIVGGVAMVIGRYSRLAASLSAIEMGLFTLLVWVPIMAAPGPKSAFQWSETVVSAALTACAWVVADSYRSLPDAR